LHIAALGLGLYLPLASPLLPTPTPQIHSGGDDALADMLDELDAAMEEAAGIKATHHALPGSLYPRSGLSYAPKPKKPQDPIHPGSTPAEDSEAGEVAARFLAYNQLGCVLSKAGEGHNFIEVRRLAQ
jgi:hypothetical protein